MPWHLRTSFGAVPAQQAPTRAQHRQSAVHVQHAHSAQVPIGGASAFRDRVRLHTRTWRRLQSRSSQHDQQGLQNLRLPHREQTLPAGWKAFVEKRMQEQHEALHALQTMHAGEPLQRGEHALAGYLLARASNGVATARATADCLRAAQATLNRTRRNFTCGRGNVRADIERTYGETSRRVDAARTAAMCSDDPIEVSLAALSLRTGAGNCGEYALVAAHFHLPRLRPCQELHVVSHRSQDHSWAEVRNAAGHAGHDDIVIDAWADGPVALREDTEYASEPRRCKIQHRHTFAERLMVFGLVAQTATDVAHGNALWRDYRAFLEINEALGYTVDDDSLWDAEAVLAECFRRATAVSLAERSSTGHTFLAIHTARNALGLSLREAIADSASMIDAAHRLV